MERGCLSQRSSRRCQEIRLPRLLRTRCTSTHHDAFSLLPGVVRKTGYKFIEKSPKAGIKHLISMMQPSHLKQRIEDALEIKQSDFEEKHFEFMEFISEKAGIFEKVYPLREYRAEAHPYNNKYRKRNCKRSGCRTHGSCSSSADKSTSSDGSKRTLPECRSTEYDKRHLIKDCTKTSVELAKRLLEDRSKKKSSNKPPKVSVVIREHAEPEQAPQGSKDSSHFILHFCRHQSRNRRSHFYLLFRFWTRHRRSF